jgi:hypothetical protein
MMKRRWPRWIIRISLVFLAVITAAVAALFIANPAAVLMLLAMLINPLVANTSPPSITENELAGANWGNKADVDKNLTALLQRKFPVGTSEDSLKSTLLGQGFKPLPLPAANCIPPGQSQPVGRPCPTYDRDKIFEYKWGDGAICGSTITVRWATDDRRGITQLDSSYYVACL